MCPGGSNCAAPLGTEAGRGPGPGGSGHCGRSRRPPGPQPGSVRDVRPRSAAGAERAPSAVPPSLGASGSGCSAHLSGLPVPPLPAARDPAASRWLPQPHPGAARIASGGRRAACGGGRPGGSAHPSLLRRPRPPAPPPSRSPSCTKQLSGFC